MRIEFDTDGVALDRPARTRVRRRLEAALGRVGTTLDRVTVRLSERDRIETRACAGRDRYQGFLRIREVDGASLQVRGAGDDPESIAARLAERAGRIVGRKLGDPSSSRLRGRRHDGLC